MLAAALFLFPLDSDAVYVVQDPVWYGEEALRNPKGSLVSHHLLFHVLVLAIAQPLRDWDLEFPGRLATRVVSGLGSAGLILLLAALAGRERRALGAGLGLLLLLTRGGSLEALTGENVIPSCTLGLLLLHLASATRPRLLLMGLLLLLALLWRQDNLLLVPGLLVAACRGLPRRGRLRPLAVFLTVVGGLALGLYLLAWKLTSSLSFWEYLTPLGAHDYAPGVEGLEWKAVPRHLAALGYAVVGRQWPPAAQEPHIWVGFAFMGLLVLAGFLLRGGGEWKRFTLAAGLTVAVRFPFFVWAEPDNAEWMLLPLVLAAGVAARAASGPGAVSPARRRAAAFLLLMIAAAVVRLHGPWTWDLRRARLAAGAEAAVAARVSGARLMAYQNRAGAALYARAVPHDVLGGELEVATAALAEMLRQDPRPTILMVDLAVQEGSPHRLRQLREEFPPGFTWSPEGAKVLWCRNGVWVLGFLLP